MKGILMSSRTKSRSKVKSKVKSDKARAAFRATKMALQIAGLTNGEGNKIRPDDYLFNGKHSPSRSLKIIWNRRTHKIGEITEIPKRDRGPFPPPPPIGPPPLKDIYFDGDPRVYARLRRIKGGADITELNRQNTVICDCFHHAMKAKCRGIKRDLKLIYIIVHSAGRNAARFWDALGYKGMFVKRASDEAMMEPQEGDEFDLLVHYVTKTIFEDVPSVSKIIERIRTELKGSEVVKESEEE